VPNGLIISWRAPKFGKRNIRQKKPLSKRKRRQVATEDQPLSAREERRAHRKGEEESRGGVVGEELPSVTFTVHADQKRGLSSTSVIQDFKGGSFTIDKKPADRKKGGIYSTWRDTDEKRTVSPEGGASKQTSSPKR